MKIRRIYKGSSSLEDFSKDRMHLDLNWDEWRELQDFIYAAKWELRKDSRIKAKAENLMFCFMNAEELEPIWDEN